MTLYLKLIHHVAKNIEPKEAKQTLVLNMSTWFRPKRFFICYLTLESYWGHTGFYYCVY